MDKRTNPIHDPKIREIMMRSWVDTRYFGEKFMPEVMYRHTWQDALEWEVIDDWTIPRVCICKWRGGGKSSKGEVYMTKSAALRIHSFHLVIGSTQDRAEEITENVKSELLSNERLMALLGNVKPKGYHEFMKASGQESYLNPNFSKASFFLANPTTNEPFAFFAPKGFRQRPRGLRVRMQGRRQRPDFLWIDDLEDDQELLNEEIRRFQKQKFYGALLPVVPQDIHPDSKTERWKPKPNQSNWRPPWRIFYVDTLKHHDALLAHLMGASDWKTVRLPQFEERIDNGRKQYFSLVPAIKSHSRVRAEIKLAKEHGRFDEYCREYGCMPMAPENASFQREMFAYYRDRDYNFNKNLNIFKALIIDPARTTNSRSAYTAILGIAIDPLKPAIYVRDLINKRLEPDEIYDQALTMAVALNTRVIATEDAGLGLHIRNNFRNAAMRRGMDIQFLWLNAQSLPKGHDFGTGSEAIKRARAKEILPYYRRGEIFHEHIIRESALEHQLLGFPQCARWDAIDCVGYIPQVMELGEVYWRPQVDKSRTGDVFEDEDDIEAMGEWIEQGEWRLVV